MKNKSQHKSARQILAMVLTMTMVLGMLPLNAVAAETTCGEIVAFEALPEATAAQTVSLGTVFADLNLPDTLTATVRVATETDTGENQESVQDSGNAEQQTDAEGSDQDADTEASSEVQSSESEAAGTTTGSAIGLDESGTSDTESSATLAGSSNFTVGDGSEESPYQITTAAQLDAVRNDLTAHYELMNDIDLTNACKYGGDYYNLGAGWVPIGVWNTDGSTEFNGTLNGNGYTITGLYINTSNGNVGLFGTTGSGGMIENLLFQSASVHTSGNTAGTLVGQNIGSIINCGVQNSSAIAGGNAAGGLVGRNDGSVQDSYALCTVSGNQYVGGLVGYSTSESIGTITNCYAAGAVSGISDLGGLLGKLASGTVTNCYYDKTVSGQSDTGKGAGLTTAQMLQQVSFTGFLFDSVWTIQENATYPYLKSTTPSVLPTPGLSVGAQSGTLTAGQNGTATFPATVVGVPDGSSVTAAWCDAVGAAAAQPTGLSLSCSNVSGNLSTVTVSADTTAVAGKYYFIVTCSDRESTVAMVNIVGSGSNDTEFTLPLGGTYYFDLSGQSVPGTVNAALPDTGLKWLPFTYVGTINAYSRTSAGTSTDGNVSVSNRKLFVADYNVTNSVSWSDLNSTGLIFGKNYSNGGIDYTIRSLSVGSTPNQGSGDTVRGVPETNEWDQILNKNTAYLKNWNTGRSWGQDTFNSFRGARGLYSIRFWYYGSPSLLDSGFGFRPALEIQNPDTLSSDALKTVTYDIGGKGTLGNNSLQTATVVYTGALTLPEITAANGFTYSGLGSGILGWYDGSTFYAPGSTAAVATGITLTAGYENPISLNGDGSADSPYQITTAAQLNAVRNNLSAYYRLENDINLTASCATGGDFYNGGMGWVPVGTDDSPFTGSFDGSNHTITGLFINRPYWSNVGLFGTVYPDGVVKNLTLKDAKVTGKNNVGCLVGYNNSTVSGCAVIGASTSAAVLQTVGGLIGSNYGAVSDSYSLSDVSGTTSCIGGLVGSADYGSITRCYAAGRVSGASDVGGLLGKSSTNCTVTDSYYNRLVSGCSDTGKGTPLTSRDMIKQSSYNGWGFGTVWAISEGASYPYLSAAEPDPLPSPPVLTVGGSFTVSDKTFDGTTTAAIAASSLTLVGLDSGDSVVINPVAAFANADPGADKTVSLTSGTTLSGGNADKYILSLAGAPTATASIGKADNTLSISCANITYGQTSLPAVVTNVGGGAVSYEYKIQGADDSTYSSTVPTAAGSYTVRGTSAATQNYNSATATANFTINKATPTAGDLDFSLAANTYNGSAQGVSVAAASGKTGLGTITVKYDGSTAAPTNAGTYTVTASLAEGGNYEATTADIHLGSYTINPADYAYDVSAQDIKAGSGLSAITAPASGTGAGAETVAGTLSWYNNSERSTAAVDSDISGKSVGDMVTLYWKFTASNSNYTNTPKTGSTVFTIEAGDPQSIAFPDSNAGVTKTYGDSPFTHAANRSVGTGDVSYASNDTSIATADSASGQVTIVKPGTVTITATAAAVPGIWAEASASYTLTVTTKTVTVAAGSYSVTKVYDGTTNAGTASGNLAVTGILPADSGVTVAALTGYYSEANAGDYTVMVLLTLDGDTGGKYMLASNTVNVPGNISKKPLTIWPTNVQGKIYGAGDPELSYLPEFGASPLPSSFTGKLSREAGEDVGIYAISSLGTLSAGNNFQLHLMEGSNFIIYQATVQSIDTTVNNVSKTAYEVRAATDAQSVVDMAGLPANVSVTTDGGTATLPVTWGTTTAYNAKSAAYSVTGTLTGNSNISVGSVTKNVTVTVTPVTPSNPSFSDTLAFTSGDSSATPQELGDTILPMSGTVTVQSESIAYTVDWNGGQTLDRTAVSNSATFTGTVSYTNVPAWLTLPGDLSVSRKVTVTAKTPVTIGGITMPDKTYDGAAYAPGGTVTVTDGTVSISDLEWKYEATDGGGYSSSTPPTNAGAYKLTISVPDSNPQYAGSQVWNFTVAKRDITLTADNKTVIKGGSLPVLTYTVGNLPEGKTSADALGVEPVLVCPTFDGSTVGTYSITITSGTATENYNITARANGTLTVAEQTYTVTFNANDGSRTGGGDLTQTIASGGSATAPIVTRSGYTFTGWDKAFNNVTSNLTVTAIWSYHGGGGGSSSGATIPDKAITDAIAKAQADASAQGRTANGISVGLNITMPQGATALTVTLTQNSLQSLIDADVSQLEINGAPVSLGLNLEALKEIQRQSGGITVSFTPATGLSSGARALIGNRPIYNITISTVRDGKTVNIASLGSGAATLFIPYTPGTNEAAGYLFGVYVDANGPAARIPGSVFDANAGGILISSNHFSVYGVGYTAPSGKFTDINTHWAKESIDYVVGRGLLSGTTETTFAPDTAMTRGMLVTALGRLAGIDTKAYTTNSFTDVTADSTFRPYIEWARSKGVIQGIGNGQFAPDRAITREEIAVIFANFAKATGYTLPVTREAVTYADSASIGSSYQTAVKAMQQAGIMMGEQNNKFNPKASATRAEVSTMLHRYIKLTIDPATAQAWAKNDAGQYFYYKDGKALTGWQTIDGMKYFFETNGVLKTGWVKDGDNWHFYSGNKMLTGWWDIGAGGNNKRYYFDTYGNMVSGKWLQIDGKWYYFNADGSLARSTTIDDYEVGEDGVRQ